MLAGVSDGLAYRLCLRCWVCRHVGDRRRNSLFWHQGLEVTKPTSPQTLPDMIRIDVTELATRHGRRCDEPDGLPHFSFSFSELMEFADELLHAKPPAAVPVVPEGMPEPEAWRVRYRSEPGMVGHYPWSYTGRKPKYLNDSANEVETLYTEAQVQSMLSAQPPAGQQDSAPKSKSAGVVNYSFVTLWLEENCKRIAWSPEGASYEITDNMAYQLASIFAPATSGEATAAQGADWLPIETAPDDELVVVFYLQKEGDEESDMHTLDLKEDGSWFYHNEHYEHFVACAPPGSIGPSEKAPYTHWKRLAAPSPAAPGNGEKS